MSRDGGMELITVTFSYKMGGWRRKGGREGEKEGGRGGREGGRGGRKGEGSRDGGREGEEEGGRESEGGKEGEGGRKGEGEDGGETEVAKVGVKGRKGERERERDGEKKRGRERKGESGKERGGGRGEGGSRADTQKHFNRCTCKRHLISCTNLFCDFIHFTVEEVEAAIKVVVFEHALLGHTMWHLALDLHHQLQHVIIGLSREEDLPSVELRDGTAH